MKKAFLSLFFLAISSMAQTSIELDAQQGFNFEPTTYVSPYSDIFPVVFRDQQDTSNPYVPFYTIEQTTYYINYYLGTSYSNEDLGSLDLGKLSSDFFTATRGKYLASIFNDYTQTQLTILAAAIIFNPQDYDKILNNSKDSLSFKNKVIFAREFGKRLGDLYNYDRADNIDNVNSIISFDQMMEAIKEKDRSLAGICGDVAATQVRILESLGVDDVYLISYKNFSSSGPGNWHLKVYAINPEDKKQGVGLNYGNIEVNDTRAGTHSLTDSGTMPDIGMDIRIHDKSGKLLDFQSTDLGKVLKKGTHENLSFHEESNSVSFNRLNYKKGSLQVAYFQAQTDYNSDVKGASASYFFNKELEYFNFDTKLSSAYAQLNGSYHYSDIKQDILYASLKHRTTYLPQFIPIEFFVEAYFDGSYQYVDFNDHKDYNYTTSDLGKIGLEIRVNITDNLALRPYIHQELHYGFSGIYNGDPKLNKLDTTVGLKLHYHSASGFEYFSDSAYITTEYGDFFTTSNYFQKGRYTLGIQYVDPIDDIPYIFEGSQKKTSLFMGVESKSLSFGAEYQFNHELDQKALNLNFQYRY